MPAHLRNIDLNLLRVFRAVAKCRGFSAAQAELNVSASTISLQMTDLETRLGARLCNRGRSGFSLTQAGRTVLEASNHLFDDIQRFQDRVDAVADDKTGELRVCVVEGNNTHFDFRLPDAIKQFHNTNSSTVIHLRVGTPSLCERLILEEQAEFGLGLFTRRIPQMEYKPLFSSRVGLYCGRDNPFFHRDDTSISKEELYAFPHVRRTYFSKEQLPESHKPFNNRAAASGVEGMTYFLLSGEFLGFLPNHYAQRWVDSGELRSLKAEDFEYTWHYYLAWKKSRDLKPVAVALIENIQNERGRMLDEYSQDSSP